MHPVTDKQKWLAQYRESQEALERIRAQELHALTDEQALRIIESLTCVDPPYRECPEWSGLIEQQRLFHRRRKT